jgi:hypothetical protein
MTRKIFINTTALFSVIWPFLFVFFIFNIPVSDTLAFYLAGIVFLFCFGVLSYLCYLISKYKDLTKKEIVYKIATALSIVIGLLLQYWLVFGLWEK